MILIFDQRYSVLCFPVIPYVLLFSFSYNPPVCLGSPLSWSCLHKHHSQSFWGFKINSKRRELISEWQNLPLGFGYLATHQSCCWLAPPQVSRFPHTFPGFSLLCIPPNFLIFYALPWAPFSHQGLREENAEIWCCLLSLSKGLQWISGAKSTLLLCLCSPCMSLHVFGVWKPYSCVHTALCLWNGLLGLVLTHEIFADHYWCVCIFFFHCSLPGCLQLT